MGKLSFDRLCGAIGRCNVSHEDFHAPAWRRFRQTFEIQLQVMLRISNNDDDRDVDGFPC
jgi:hypothetical protein